MNKLSYFKIGLFVISATVLAVIGIIVLGVGSVFQRAALVETYIEESVQGLDIGGHGRADDRGPKSPSSGVFRPRSRAP